MTTFAAFDRWLERGDTAAARLLGTLRFGDGGFGQSDIALLPAPDGQQAARIAAGMEADPDFCRHPRWNDAPAETGALARRHADPIVAELRTRFGHSALTRFAARLRELGALLAGTATLRAGSVPLGGGRGLGWVENARGLLVHLTVVADGRVVRHRILAPTEWNFHPQGALAAGLRGTRYASEADLRHRAALLVQSLDPCVACRIELAHA
jgi:Ni,Fe-hydrogenase I large subunit